MLYSLMIGDEFFNLHWHTYRTSVVNQSIIWDLLKRTIQIHHARPLHRLMQPNLPKFGNSATEILSWGISKRHKKLDRLDYQVCATK